MMLVRLATRCSWDDTKRLRGKKVSDTTVRDRGDEWIAAGIFDTQSGGSGQEMAATSSVAPTAKRVLRPARS